MGLDPSTLECREGFVLNPNEDIHDELDDLVKSGVGDFDHIPEVPRRIRTRKLKGVTVLEGEVGTRFYHKHKSKKAVARKKKRRKAGRRSRRKMNR